MNSRGTSEHEASQESSEAIALSVVIPAHNEEQNLAPTVSALVERLRDEGYSFEIVVVNDNSSDGTFEVLESLAQRYAQVRAVHRTRLGGFGRAIRAGLDVFRGEAVVIVMADRSDDPEDIVRYYQKIREGYDCVFGSRFRRESTTVDYPPLKLLVNRLVNKAIQALFWTRFNDLTNAFKIYRREVIQECGPYSSSHFNITIEMSLTALIRRYHIAEIPISWYGRTWGASNLSISRMGRRYMSVLLKVFFDRMLISDDILEERLAHRVSDAETQMRLEARLERLGGEVGRIGSSPGFDEDD